MDTYEVVLEKIVRDLFKSAPIVQIKKYKFSKENEILEKEENLKNLILEKYPILLKSIHSLEKISTNLSELQDIRHKLGENMSNFKLNDYLKNNNIHDINFERIIHYYDNDANFEDFIEDIIEDKLHEINTVLEKKDYNDLSMKLISLHQYLKEKLFENNAGILSDVLLSDQFNAQWVYERIDLILMEFMESIMLKFINEEECFIDISTYFFYFFSIFYCVNDESKLTFSELYFKIKNDSILNRIFDNCFNLSEYTDKGYNIDPKLVNTINFTIKLFILKISKSFSSLGKNHKKIVYLLYNASNLIQFFYSVSYYVIFNEKSVFFNLKNILINFQIIFKTTFVCEKKMKGNEDIDSNGELAPGAQVNEDTNNKEFNFNEIINSLFTILKKEIEASLEIKSEEENLIDYFNFYKCLLEVIISNEAELDEKIAAVLASNYAKRSSKTEKNSVKWLFNLLYIDVFNSNIGKLIKKELNQTNVQNFRSSDSYLSSSEDSTIFYFLEEIANESDFSFYYANITETLNHELTTYLKESAKYIESNRDKIGEEEFKDFLDFLSIKYSNKKVIDFLKKLHFSESLTIVKGLSSIYIDIQHQQIEEEMKYFIDNLEIENYLVIKKDSSNDASLLHSIDNSKFSNNLSKVEMTKSFFETLSHINEKYNFSIAESNFNEDQEEKENDSESHDRPKTSSLIKLKILKLFLSSYEKFLSKTQKIFNPSIAYDVILIHHIDSSNHLNLELLSSKYQGSEDLSQIAIKKEKDNIKLKNVLKFFTEEWNIVMDKEPSKNIGMYKKLLSKIEKYEEDVVDNVNKYDLRYSLRNFLQEKPNKDKAKRLKPNSTNSFKLFDARIDESYQSVKETDRTRQTASDRTIISPSKPQNATTTSTRVTSSQSTNSVPPTTNETAASNNQQSSFFSWFGS